jgi:Spy/CpxP family protein refolding chaperone
MKTKIQLLTIGGVLALALTSVSAQDTNTNTNAIPLTQTVKYQNALEHERSLGERSLLPPGVKEKLKLTDDQLADLKPIEDDFANTCQQYQTANQSRIDAAVDAGRRARDSKDETQIEQARKQLQEVWAGLQPYRTRAVKQVRKILTPDQLVILDDPQNQWRENHGTEANDPSAN